MCPRCGRPLRDEDKVCPYCGIELSRARYCPHCGMRVAQVAKTCLLCGASLEGEDKACAPLTVPSISLFSSIPVIPLIVAAVLLGLLVVILGSGKGEPQPAAVGLQTATPPTATLPPTATSTATSSPTPTLTPTPAPTPTPIVHVVQPGDTILSIATWYGSRVELIMEANGLDESSLLQVDQELIVPIPTPTPEIAPQPTDPIVVTAVSTATPEMIIHVVQPGEYPGLIAEQYGTTAEAIMAANNIADPRSLRVGQELLIPVASSGEVKTTKVQVVVHVVQPGDTLLGIAFRYGATVEGIMGANDIDDPRSLQVGQELIVPIGTPTPTPTLTPHPTPTLTPGPRYPAPALLAPIDGAVFRGEKDPILLNWASVGILAADEWYVVRLRYIEEGAERAKQLPGTWTKSTAWRVPPNWRPPEGAQSHLFRWSVTVVLQSGGRDDGTWETLALSPMSQSRSFFWY